MKDVKLENRGTYKIDVYIDDVFEESFKNFSEFRKFLIPVTCDLGDLDENGEPLQTKIKISELIKKKKSFKIENFVWLAEFDSNLWNGIPLTEEELEHLPQPEPYEVKLEVKVEKILI